MLAKFHTIPAEFLYGLALVLTEGMEPRPGDTKVRGLWGWRDTARANGVTATRHQYYDSLMRHVNAAVRGERADPKSGHSHWLHAGANCVALFDLYNMEDDRPDV